MSEFAARIRRVKMKDGGADLTLLANPMDDADGEENWRGKIIEHARGIANLATEEAPLVGFLTLGFFSDGGSSSAFRIHHELCPVPIALMPAWAAEIVRRDLIVGQEAENAFDRMFEWVE